MQIIIYGSEYGTAKIYAEELSRQTGIKAVAYTEIKSVDEYEMIIYIGALYAGGVLGMSKTLKKISKLDKKKLVIVTVGLADPIDKENVNNIRNGIKKQISFEVFQKAYIYHLRGGIDYSKLNFKHKTMMALLYKKASKLPEEKKTAEVRAMIDTYGKKVDFIDFTCLKKIIDNI